MSNEDCIGCRCKFDWCCTIFKWDAVMYTENWPCKECILKTNCSKVCNQKIDYIDRYSRGFYDEPKKIEL